MSEIGDLENELGFVEGEIAEYEDRLAALREHKISLVQEIAQEKASG